MIILTFGHKTGIQVSMTSNGTQVKTHHVNLMATGVMKPIPEACPIRVPIGTKFAEIHFEAYEQYLCSQITYLAIPFSDWKSQRVGVAIDHADSAILSRLTAHIYDTAIYGAKYSHNGRCEAFRLFSPTLEKFGQLQRGLFEII
eukprot:Pompholyxophrys_punicea_v1_NODE_460_length_1909_cov_7.339266.p3 type:complete len:144 gc:universal NODE_460_length_1909_cov_7.339266:1343-1774(+)